MVIGLGKEAQIIWRKKRRSQKMESLKRKMNEYEGAKE